MSVSCKVKGLKPITDDYKKRLEIYKSCIELKISPPEEIRKYFEYDSEPCDEGIIVCLEEDAVSESIGYTSVYYDPDSISLEELQVAFEVAQKEFPNNQIIFVSDKMRVELWDKDTLENQISTLNEILKKL